MTVDARHVETEQKEKEYEIKKKSILLLLPLSSSSRASESLGACGRKMRVVPTVVLVLVGPDRVE